MNIRRFLGVFFAALIGGEIAGAPVRGFPISLASAQQITPDELVAYPATGIWNTFLNQLNVVECNNFATVDTTIEISLRDSQGGITNTLSFVISASNTFHLVLNPLVTPNQYGTYRLHLPSGNNGQLDRLRCVTAFYRMSAQGTNKLIDYGYAVPVMNPTSGISGGTFNSYNPENGTMPVANWLSLVNSSESPLSGDIDIYNQAGTLDRSIPISSILPGGRQDVPLGHEVGQVTGLYRFRPSDPTQDYFGFLIRYSVRGPNFNFAFPLFASRGACSTEPIFASTMDPALNWAEVANLSNRTATLALEVRNSIGTLLRTEPLSIPAFSQQHVFVNEFLGTSNTGTLKIACFDTSQEVFVQSVFYGKESGLSSNVAWAYAKQQVGFAAKPGQFLANSANTFLGMYNWVRVLERNFQPATIDVETYPSGSRIVLNQAAPLREAGNADVPVSAVLGANQVAGSLVSASVGAGTLVGDLIRVMPDSKGRIGTIMPIPAAVIPGDLAKLKIQQVVSGLTNPILATNAGDGSGRMFIIEQGGKIRILKNGTLLPTPFLDITGLVSTDGEQGLLGLAFHPNYENNRRFFIYYTNTSGNTEVVEFLASVGDADIADSSSGRRLLTVAQPFANHNGGHLAFGKDGYLYIALGDGGSANDPQGNGQNLDTLLGKMLRIDINTGDPYGIPSDNPFVNQAGKDEIWAYGLRNPWRFSVDRESGRIFIGDVGQATREEVNIGVAGGNFGWNTMEGSLCFNPSTNCNKSGKILPIAEYGHDLGISITGGYVYRGTAIPALSGQYLFGDFGSSRIWSLEERADSTWLRRELLSPGLLISSFGEDEDGELYVVDIRGGIYKVLDAGSP